MRAHASCLVIATLLLGAATCASPGGSPSPQPTPARAIGCGPVTCTTGCCASGNGFTCVSSDSECNGASCHATGRKTAKASRVASSRSSLSFQRSIAAAAARSSKRWCAIAMRTARASPHPSTASPWGRRTPTRSRSACERMSSPIWVRWDLRRRRDGPGGASSTLAAPASTPAAPAARRGDRRGARGGTRRRDASTPRRLGLDDQSGACSVANRGARRETLIH
jgi:hypothetical protein